MTAGGSLRDWTSMTWFSYGWPGPFLEVGQYSKAPKDLYSTNTPLSLLSLENAGFRWFCECGIAAEDAIVFIYDRDVFFQAVGRGFDPRLPLHHLKGLSPRPKAHRAYDSTTGCLNGTGSGTIRFSRQIVRLSMQNALPSSWPKPTSMGRRNWWMRRCSGSRVTRRRNKRAWNSSPLSHFLMKISSGRPGCI